MLWVVIDDLRLLVQIEELAHLVELEEVVVLARIQLLRVLVVFVARIETLLLRFELDAIVRVGLLLLFTE